jgi:hypothetical protein
MRKLKLIGKQRQQDDTLRRAGALKKLARHYFKEQSEDGGACLYSQLLWRRIVVRGQLWAKNMRCSLKNKITKIKRARVWLRWWKACLVTVRP